MLANPLRNIRNNESPKIRAGLSVLMPTFSCDSRSHGIAAIDAKKSTIFFESKSVNVGNCCDGCLFITLFLFVCFCLFLERQQCCIEAYRCWQKSGVAIAESKCCRDCHLFDEINSR